MATAALILAAIGILVSITSVIVNLVTNQKTRKIAQQSLEVSRKQYEKKLGIETEFEYDRVDEDSQSGHPIVRGLQLSVRVVNHGAKVILRSVRIGYDNAGTFVSNPLPNLIANQRLPFKLERNESWQGRSIPSNEGDSRYGMLFAADTVVVETACGHHETTTFKPYRERRRERIEERERHRGEPAVFDRGPGDVDAELAEKAGQLDDIQYEIMAALAVCPEVHTVRDRGDWQVNIGTAQKGGLSNAEEGERFNLATRTLSELGYLKGDLKAVDAVWELTEEGERLTKFIASQPPRPTA